MHLIYAEYLNIGRTLDSDLQDCIIFDASLKVLFLETT